MDSQLVEVRAIPIDGSTYFVKVFKRQRGFVAQYECASCALRQEIAADAAASACAMVAGINAVWQHFVVVHALRGLPPAGTQG